MVTYPRVPGIEGVGVVDEADENIELRPGQQVATMMGGIDTAELYGWGTSNNEVLLGKAGSQYDLVAVQELGIAFVPYSPLGRGFITGTAKPAGQDDVTDLRNTNPRWQPGNFEKNVEAVDRLGRLATAKGITVSQLALAWLLAQGEHIVPIPGTRSAARMEENAHAADVTLTEADLAAIHEILPTGGFGARYAEEHVLNWV